MSGWKSGLLSRDLTDLMTILMYGPKVGDFDPEPAVHIQGGHNKNKISKNKECLQKMLMWRSFVRASSNSVRPVKKNSGPVNFLTNSEHCITIGQRATSILLCKHLEQVGTTLDQLSDRVNLFSDPRGSSGNKPT